MPHALPLLKPHPLAGLLLATYCVVASPSAARAYCRTTTTSMKGSCECPEGGIPLAWNTPDLRYALHEQLFPGLNESEVRQVFDDSFAAWTQVTCEGEPIGLTVEADPELTSQPPSSDKTYSADDLNVMKYYPPEEWSADPRAFALTGILFDDASGRILGASIIFNGLLGPYGLCSEAGCEKGVVDLRNIVTHEAGHFLGLDHSDDPEATMACSAETTDTNKRTLEHDDIEGLCAAYPPGEAFPADSPEDGCTLGSRQSKPAAWLLAIFALTLRRRTRLGRV